MYCTACGTQNQAGTRFCTNCGAPMNAEAQPPVAPNQQAPTYSTTSTDTMPERGNNHGGTTNDGATVNNNWYYEQDGERHGPLSNSEIEALISRKTICQDTLLWSGRGDWIPADRTQLAHLFASATAAPPPLPSQKVNDSMVWIAVSIPILGAIIEEFFGSNLGENADRIFLFGYLLIYIALLTLDEKRLEAAGYKAPAIGWVFLVPVYLWRRASLLNHKQSYSLAWIGAFVVACFLNPLSNPFAEANVSIQCDGTGIDTAQCQFKNEGSAPGTMCVDVVLVCGDGRHISHTCSSSISPGGEEPKVLNQWSPAVTSQTSCGGFEYVNMKVTVP